jgi:hypothetical protein
MNTASSFRSLFSKSQKSSGQSSNSGSEAGSNMDENENDEDGDGDTVYLKINPLLVGLNEIFEQIDDGI